MLRSSPDHICSFTSVFHLYFLTTITLIVIIITILPTRSQMILWARQFAHMIRNPDGKLLRQYHWPQFADENTKAYTDEALARPQSW